MEKGLDLLRRTTEVLKMRQFEFANSTNLDEAAHRDFPFFDMI